MSLISINGTALPTPSGLIVDTDDITNAERNASGTMIIELIATKRKLELTWANIKNSDMITVRGLIESNVTMSATYIDPNTGTTRTGTFYKGDRSAGLLRYWYGEVYWKDFKFNLIEL